MYVTIDCGVGASPVLARFLREALYVVELERHAIVGFDATRPRSEHLMGTTAGAIRELVVTRRQHDVELSAGIDDMPRLQRRIPVVLPLQFGAELRQPAVDDDAVLG